MASVVWMTIFVFLILELIVTLILVIPVPRPIRNKISRYVFRFHLGGDKFHKAIWFIAIGLCLALVDCYFKVKFLQEKLLIMEHQDYENSQHHHGHHHDKQKLYKAERNMYLAGFALTLLLVIGRLTVLMQESVELEDECERVRLSSKPAVSSEQGGDENKNGVELTEIRTKKPADKKKD